MYQQKTYDLGWMKVVEKSYPGNYGAPGKKRQEKKNRTPEDVERHNEKLRIRKLQMLIAANFKKGDLHVTLTYRARDAPDLDGSRKSLKAFLTRMRKEYKKHGHALKWICVTEKTQKGVPHHHLLIEDIPGLNATSMVSRLWPNGRTFFSVLDPDMEYQEKEGGTTEDNPKEYYGLADYLQKKQSKSEKGCRYSRSRNLITPVPKVEKIHRRRWNRSPKPERGWYISHLENGENPFTGYPYQRYILRRLDNERRRRP